MELVLSGFQARIVNIMLLIPLRSVVLDDEIEKESIAHKVEVLLTDIPPACRVVRCVVEKASVPASFAARKRFMTREDSGSKMPRCIFKFEFTLQFIPVQSQ